jgi:hypothetical protein
MPLRAPVRLWRFLLADLFRLGLLAASSLVVVIAFAFSIRFLAEGRVDLNGALRLTGLALVPMLQYALPFACGFAATLAYHRFAADNEAAAAMAGGVAHRALLVPAAIAGLALALTVAALAHLVIPRFLRTMERLVTSDLSGVLQRSILRGESVRLGNVELHARDIVSAGPDRQVAAFERLRLSGVLAATLDSQGRVQGYISAEEVLVWLYQEESGGDDYTSVQFAFKGASGEGVGDVIQSGQIDTHRIRIPSTFVDDPKFLTWSELRALRTRPEKLGKIDALRHRLAHRLEEAAAVESLAASLAAGGSATLERPGLERIFIHSAAIIPEGDRWAIESEPGAPILIERRTGSKEPLRLASGRAWLEREVADLRGLRDRPTFRLRLEDPSPADPDAPLDAGAPIVITALSLPGTGASAAVDQPVPRLLTLAGELAGRRGPDASTPVRDAAAALAAKVADVQREVTSKQHERAAYAVACLLTLLAGAVTALRRAGSLPLPVYLWSFFPALASVITISAGQGLTHKTGWPGLILLWGGVAALAFHFAREYARLARH